VNPSLAARVGRDGQEGNEEQPVRNVIKIVSSGSCDALLRFEMQWLEFKVPVETSWNKAKPNSQATEAGQEIERPVKAGKSRCRSTRSSSTFVRTRPIIAIPLPGV